MCFGVASFFMGDVSRKGMVAKYLLSVGFVIVALVYMLVAFVGNYRKGIRVWSLIDNDWIHDDANGDRRIWYAGFLAMIFSAAGNFVGTYFVALTFETSIYAGVNQGVISTLFVLSAVFCAILAYVLLKETMDISQYIGMVLMIGCAVLLSLSQESKNIVEIASSERISALIPVLAAICSSLGFGIRSIIM